jgi:hypothetical protein
LAETSEILAIRPDLVHSGYKTLADQVGRTLGELHEIATARCWQRYFSSPSKSTAAYGRALKEWWIEGFMALILRAVRGRLFP